MNFKYPITKECHQAISKYDWIKENFALEEVGKEDDHELVRLLDNTHYSHIANLLSFINQHGDKCPIISNRLLECNDMMQLSRILAELYLFVHLYKIHNDKVKVIEPKPNVKIPDFKIPINDKEIVIELFTPTDFYAYQLFKRKISQITKYLKIDIGYKLELNTITENNFFTSEFPEFREMIPWFDRFERDLSDWILTSNNNYETMIDGPISSLKIKIKLLAKFPPDTRIIYWGHATISTDTRLFFDIKDPHQFSRTEWGSKIKDKLQYQQAGTVDPKKIRLFILNFANSDTADLSFLNEKRYKENIRKDIKFLASDIAPYPPYDIVIPCTLDFECGFSSPIRLTKDDTINENDVIEYLWFNKPIKEIPRATKEEIEKLFDKLLEMNRERECN